MTAPTDDECGHHDEPTRNYSLLSWFVVVQALERNDCSRKIAVGDWVAECSHLIGCGRATMADDRAIGQVTHIYNDNDMTLKCLDGVEQRWTNALFRLLPKPRQNLTGEPHDRP